MPSVDAQKAVSLVHGKIVQKAYHRDQVTKIMPRLNGRAELSP